MAAGEDEAQPFVGDRAHVVLLLGSKLLQAGEQLGLSREGALAADAVDRAIPRGGNDPRGRVARRPVARPALECGRERVLHRVLGELEVAEDADQNRDGASPFLAEEGLDAHSAIGRISTDPVVATGTRCASSIAWSRSLHSARK